MRQNESCHKIQLGPTGMEFKHYQCSTYREGMKLGRLSSFSPLGLF